MRLKRPRLRVGLIKARWARHLDSFVFIRLLVSMLLLIVTTSTAPTLAEAGDWKKTRTRPPTRGAPSVYFIRENDCSTASLSGLFGGCYATSAPLPSVSGSRR